MLSLVLCVASSLSTFFTTGAAATDSPAQSRHPSGTPTRNAAGQMPQNSSAVAVPKSAFASPVAAFFNRTLAAARAGRVGALRRVASRGNRVGSWGTLLCNHRTGEDEELVLFLGAGDATEKHFAAADLPQELRGENLGGLGDAKQPNQASRTGDQEAERGRHVARETRIVQAAIDTVTLLHMLHCRLTRVVDLRNPSHSFLLKHLQHTYRMRKWRERVECEAARDATRQHTEAHPAETGDSTQAANPASAEAREGAGEAKAAEPQEDFAADGEPILSVVYRKTGVERLFFGFKEIQEFLLARLVVKARRMALEQQRAFLRRAHLLTAQADAAPTAEKVRKAGKAAQRRTLEAKLPIGHPVPKHWWDPLGLTLDLYTAATCSKGCPELKQIVQTLAETGFVDVIKVHSCDPAKADVPPIIGTAGLAVLPALGIGTRVIFGTEEIVRFLHVLASFIPTPKALREALRASQPSPNNGAPSSRSPAEALSLPPNGVHASIESPVNEHADADDDRNDVWPSLGGGNTGESVVLRLPERLRDSTLVCDTVNLDPCQRLLDWLSGRGLFDQVRKRFAAVRPLVQSDMQQQKNEPLLVKRGVIVARGVVDIQAWIAAAYVAADPQSWTCTPVIAEAFLAAGRPVTNEAVKIVEAMNGKGLHNRVRIRTLPNLQPVVVNQRVYRIPSVHVHGIAEFTGLNEVKAFFFALVHLVKSAN